MDETGPPSGCPAIGVVGASARAAIHSLLRAGLKGWAVDLFADRDLKRLAPHEICPPSNFPHGLLALIDGFPPGAILYTGGLENYPEIVSRLAAKRPLLGNPPDVLKRVRNPYFVNCIQSQGILHPRIILAGDLAPGSGRWLRKPLRSSSGHGIRYARPQESASSGHYFQEFIAGPSMSALFVSDAAGTRPLGITEQLIGQPWLYARPFAYCGNVGPVRLPEPTEDAIDRFGIELASAAGLRGLWGVDFILNGDLVYPHPLASSAAGPHPPAPSLLGPHPPTPSPRGRGGVRGRGDLLPLSRGERGLGGEGPAVRGPGGEGLPLRRPEGEVSIKTASSIVYPVEVNPRYTAAIEVLELAGKFPSLRLHHHCFTQPDLKLGQEYPGRPTSMVGKAIYYAPHSFVFPLSGPWDEDLAHPFDPWRVPAFADIPDPGSPIEAGSPVFSLFATGSTATDCLERLQSRARELDCLFAGSTR